MVEETNAAATHAIGINWIDVVVVLMMLASGAFAMMRGFVKEGFVLVSLVGATIVASKFFPHVQPWMRAQFESKIVADICAGLGLFVLTLIVFIPITGFFVDKVKGNAMTAIDKSLGFVFGVLRGLLIACLLYLLAAQFWDKPKDAPKAVREARIRPVLEAGAKLVRDIIPARKKEDGMDEYDETGSEDGSADKPERIRKAQELLQRLAQPEPEMNKHQPAYDQQARKNLDDLIQKKSPNDAD